MASSSSSAGPRYSWELPAGQDLPDTGAAEEGHWADSDASDGEVGPEEAALHLFDLLVALKDKGTLNADTCCTLAHWANLAGAGPPVGRLAFRPDAPSGHYAWQLTSVLKRGAVDSELYVLAAPGCDKVEAARVERELPVTPHARGAGN